SIGRLHREKLQGDTILLKSLQSLEFDFSVETIKLLFKLGYNDALDGFNEYIESKNEHVTE
ncbi:MAG: hypothetical protein WAL46_02225, partial [Nitrososphaeraceae archaeon]